MKNLAELARNARWPKRVVLIRHAQSVRNKVKKGNIYLPKDESAALVKGIPDHKIQITDVGKEQALQTGVALRQKYGLFDYFYASTHVRTIETRDHILKAYSPSEIESMEFRESPLIIERRAGYAHNMTDDEVAQHFPYLQAHWKEQGPYHFEPPGGESHHQVQLRTEYFKDKLRQYRAGQNACVVSHGGTIRNLRLVFEKWSPSDFDERYADPVDNCALFVYEFDPELGRLGIVSSNEILYARELVTC